MLNPTLQTSQVSSIPDLIVTEPDLEVCLRELANMTLIMQHRDVMQENLGFPQGPTQTGLYNLRRKLEA